MRNKVLKNRQVHEGKKLFSRCFSCIVLMPLAYTDIGYAASDAPMFSMANTDFVVAIAFVIFVGVLVYFKVPRIIGNLLDKRAGTIRNEIDEAHRLLEEAKTLLAKLEREHKENIEKAKNIVNDAELTSKKVLEDSKSEIKDAVARKLQMAERQIQTNEKEVIKSIKDDLIEAAFKEAQEQIEKKVDSNLANLVVEESVEEIKARLS
ncbi:MAG: ATP F0F1 synthase subunit B [Paracoccaceae bacterium]|nr:ATP F0F1 synthase subunit B [Paracoccaceae bacterium]